MGVYVRYSCSGKTAIAVTDAKPVIFQAKLLANLCERAPEVMLSHWRQVEDIIGVLLRKHEQMERCALVREFVAGSSPMVSLLNLLEGIPL